MIPCHRRHLYLKLIVEEFKKVQGKPWPDTIDLFFIWFPDRPTQEVSEALRDLPGFVITSPFKLVDDREYFMQARQWQFEEMKKRLEPKWVSVWDDDILPCDIKKMEWALLRNDVDLIYTSHLSLWDGWEQYNHKVQHRTPSFFRFDPDDRFPTDRMIQCTERINDNPRAVIDIELPNLHMGYKDADDRRMTFEAYRRAGKIDPYTMLLVDEPDLRRLPGELMEKSNYFREKLNI